MAVRISYTIFGICVAILIFAEWLAKSILKVLFDNMQWIIETINNSASTIFEKYFNERSGCFIEGSRKEYVSIFETKLWNIVYTIFIKAKA